MSDYEKSISRAPRTDAEAKRLIDISNIMNHASVNPNGQVNIANIRPSAPEALANTEAGYGIISAAEPLANLTLPTDSNERKNYPVLSGCLKYLPAAIAGVSKISKIGNDKHNPGQPLHHARGKSMDHSDCIVRHLIDTEDLLAALSRTDSTVTKEQVLFEASQLAWRALAYSQELHERFGAPLAPGAKK